MKRTIFCLVIVLMVLAMALPATATPAQASNGVEVQIAMVLDGSLSISSSAWNIIRNGLAAAVENPDCVPQDGSVELTVIQFGSMSSPGAEVEIGPVVINTTNAATIATQIRAIVQNGGYTPLSCAIRLAADTLAGSSNFNSAIKQAINIVTDGVPNRCCPETYDCIAGEGSCGVDGCNEAKASAVAARNYAISTLQMTADQDEIDAEGIGITDTNRDWLRDNIVWPQPGYIAPPFEGPGWVRVVADADDFAETICEKFEIVVYGSITAHKFNDVNGDGDQDGGEDDLSGWNMTLYSGSDCSGGEVDSGTTDSNGNVVFTGLEAGTYSVRETLKGGWTNSTALCQQVTLDAGESATLNFGNFELNPDIDAEKAVNATIAKPGDPLTFTISYNNTGNIDLTGVVITDIVDANLENVSPQDGGTYNATTRTITWDIGDVAVDTGGSVSFTADIVSPLDNGTIIENFGTIDSDQTDPEDTNTTETEVESAPDFSVDEYNYKEVDQATAEPGDTLTFTIYYKNTGNMDATGVVITDIVDANLENVVPADGGSYNDTTRTITWDIGDVAVDTGGSVSFTADIVSPLDDGTIIENFGTIDSDQTAPEDTNTTVTEVESAPPPTPPTGGGGGGGGGVKYLTVNWTGSISTITTKPLYSNDRLKVDLLGPSPDGMHSLFLEQGTHAPVVGGKTYYLITIIKLEPEDIPPLPENTVAIVVVNITPAGAEFNRDIFLTLGLDELQLPENALNVTMDYYDDVNGVWVPLESEPGGLPNTVAELSLTAPLNHFSIFGVLVEVSSTTPTTPAHFVFGGLNIVPSVEKTTFVTKIGESVTIAATITNDGGQVGTYTVELKLNGETVDTTTVMLGAGQSQQVSFTRSGLDDGQYDVEVAGLSGEFTTSRTITWWLIILIIAAIGLIIWGVVWSRRRRKAHKAA